MHPAAQPDAAPAASSRASTPDLSRPAPTPQVSQLLGVPAESWPPGSFESGQMVVDKARHWRGLVMAMYLNSYASFWCVCLGLI